MFLGAEKGKSSRFKGEPHNLLPEELEPISPDHNVFSDIESTAKSRGRQKAMNLEVGPYCLTLATSSVCADLANRKRRAWTARMTLPESTAAARGLRGQLRVPTNGLSVNN